MFSGRFLGFQVGWFFRIWLRCCRFSIMRQDSLLSQLGLLRDNRVCTLFSASMMLHAVPWLMVLFLRLIYVCAVACYASVAYVRF